MIDRTLAWTVLLSVPTKTSLSLGQIEISRSCLCEESRFEGGSVSSYLMSVHTNTLCHSTRRINIPHISDIPSHDVQRFHKMKSIYAKNLTFAESFQRAITERSEEGKKEEKKKEQLFPPFSSSSPKRVASVVSAKSRSGADRLDDAKAHQDKSIIIRTRCPRGTKGRAGIRLTAYTRSFVIHSLTRTACPPPRPLSPKWLNKRR